MMKVFNLGGMELQLRPALRAPGLEAARCLSRRTPVRIAGSCGMECWSDGTMELGSHIGLVFYQYSHTGAQRAHGILAQGIALGRHEQNIAG